MEDIKKKVFFISAHRDGSETGVMAAARNLGFKTTGYTQADNPHRRDNMKLCPTYQEAIAKNTEKATITFFVMYMTDKDKQNIHTSMEGHHYYLNPNVQEIHDMIKGLLPKHEKVIVNIIGQPDEECKYIKKAAYGIYMVGLNKLLENGVQVG